MKPSTQSRKKLEVIWSKGIKAVDPRGLVAHFVQSDASFQSVLSEAASVLVVGGVKLPQLWHLALNKK